MLPGETGVDFGGIADHYINQIKKIKRIVMEDSEKEISNNTKMTPLFLRRALFSLL